MAPLGALQEAVFGITIAIFPGQVIGNCGLFYKPPRPNAGTVKILAGPGSKPPLARYRNRGAVRVKHVLDLSKEGGGLGIFTVWSCGQFDSIVE
jgi:hypothetical protein